MSEQPATVTVKDGTPGIYKALVDVMEAVGAVGKDGQYDAFGTRYRFRGIDAVVNSVSPALRKAGVVVYPRVTRQDIDYQQAETAKGKPMVVCRIIATYVFAYVGDGSSIEVTVPGEGFDSADKATAKAMSVAMRTALLQALCLPTDDIDPDAERPELGGQGIQRIRTQQPDQWSTPPAQPAPPSLPDLIRRGLDQTTVDGLRQVWNEASRFGMLKQSYDGKQVQDWLVARDVEIKRELNAAEGKDA